MIEDKGQQLLTKSDLAHKFNIPRATLNKILHDKFFLRLGKAHPKTLEKGLMTKRRTGWFYTPEGTAEVERILREAGQLKD